MADTVTRRTDEELVVVAVAVGLAGGTVGAGVGGSAVGVAVGGVVAVRASEVAVGADSGVEVGSEVAVGVGSGVDVGDGGGCVAAAVRISAAGSVAGIVVATACGAASLPACGGGGAGSVVQASSRAAMIRMTARNVLNSVTPRDVSGLRANGGNCPTSVPWTGNDAIMVRSRPWCRSRAGNRLPRVGGNPRP